MGASAGTLAESAGKGKGNMAVSISIVVLGVVSAVAGVFLTGFFVRNELNQMIEESKAAIYQDSGNNLSDSSPAVERAEAV